MDWKKRQDEYQQRWNIAVPTEAQFVEFRNRGVLVLEDVLAEYRGGPIVELDRAFLYATGRKQPPRAYVAVYGLLTFPESVVRASIAASADVPSLVHNLQKFFDALEATRSSIASGTIEDCGLAVQQAASLSPAVGIAVAVAAPRVTLFPAGATLLDKALVNDVLGGLQDYPDIAKRYEAALSLYMAGDPKQHRNLLDDLRFSLEQLLKAVLGNDKSLENQQEALGQWLEKHGLHVQTRNLFRNLLFGPYSIFQNEAVKHAEEFSSNDVEFTIYQTGVFMRMVLRLARANRDRR